MFISEYLRDQPRMYMLLLAIVFIVLIGVLDYNFGETIVFSSLYLIPVAVAAVSLGWFGGTVASVAATGSWLAVAYKTSEMAMSDPLTYLNVALVFLPLFMIAFAFGQVKDAYQEQWLKARHDKETGLFSRDFFFENARSLYEEAQAKQSPLTIAAVRVYDLRQFELTSGQWAYNDLLQSVGQLVKRSLRRQDLEGRTADDTVTALLPATGGESAQFFLSRLQKRFDALIEKHEYKIAYAIGASTFLVLPDSFEVVRDSVAELIVEAQESGGNSLKFELAAEGRG